MIATMIMGLPGSGKTTYAKIRFPSTIKICRDNIRLMLYGEYKFNPEHEPMILKMSHACMKQAARFKEDIVIDETQANHAHRLGLIKYLKDLKYEVSGIYLKVDPAECIRRRANENKGVDSDWSNIITRMASKFIEPTIFDGYDKLITVGE